MQTLNEVDTMNNGNKITKEIFIKRRNIIEETILHLKKVITENDRQIETIAVEGLSVVEYSLDKSDVERLAKESERFKEAIEVIERLRGFLEDWYLRVKVK